MDDKKDSGTDGENSQNFTPNKKAMLEALKTELSNVSKAADKARISRRQHYNWLKDDPEYKKEVDSIKQRGIDFVEGKLMELISGQKDEKGNYTVMPDKTSIIFFLKTQAKDRGYTERIEVEDKTSLENQLKNLSTEEIIDIAFGADQKIKALMDEKP